MSSSLKPELHIPLKWINPNHLQMLGNPSLDSLHQTESVLIGDGEKKYFVKHLLSNQPSDRSAMISFLNEIFMSRSIEHPAIVPVCYFSLLDQNFEFDPICITEEAGMSLAYIITCAGNVLLSEVGFSISHLLNELHQRCLVHLDIKPDNIVVENWGSNSQRSRLIDFERCQTISSMNVNKFGIQTKDAQFGNLTITEIMKYPVYADKVSLTMALKTALYSLRNQQWTSIEKLTDSECNLQQFIEEYEQYILAPDEKLAIPVLLAPGESKDDLVDELKAFKKEYQEMKLTETQLPDEVIEQDVQRMLFTIMQVICNDTSIDNGYYEKIIRTLQARPEISSMLIKDKEPPPKPVTRRERPSARTSLIYPKRIPTNAGDVRRDKMSLDKSAQPQGAGIGHPQEQAQERKVLPQINPPPPSEGKPATKIKFDYKKIIKSNQNEYKYHDEEGVLPFETLRLFVKDGIPMVGITFTDAIKIPQQTPKI